MWILLPPAVHGFWGAPTASVDWCETNYAHSFYIAESFNTWSSGALIAAGLLGAYWHRRVLEWRFRVVFWSVALVGVGSVAFHGTLLFQLQMLDELPMLYTAALLVYLLLEDSPEPRYGRWLPLGLMLYAASATYAAAFTRGDTQFWLFQVSFASLECFALYRTFLIYRRSESVPQRRLFRRGMLLYLLAIALWFVDIQFCQQLIAALAAIGLPNLQLHAWWHVLVAGGLYALILVIAYHRLHMLGRAPSLQGAALLPRLRVTAPARS